MSKPNVVKETALLIETCENKKNSKRREIGKLLDAEREECEFILEHEFTNVCWKSRGEWNISIEIWIESKKWENFVWKLKSTMTWSRIFTLIFLHKPGSRHSSSDLPLMKPFPQCFLVFSNGNYLSTTGSEKEQQQLAIYRNSELDSPKNNKYLNWFPYEEDSLL